MTPEEAGELLVGLEFWAEAVEEGLDDPGWHMHITDAGRELTVAINAEDARGRFANRSAKPS